MIEYPEYIEESLNDLYDQKTNSPEYCLTKGNLYKNLSKDNRFTEKDAMQVTRFLNNGDVADADIHIQRILEEDEK